MIKRTIVFLFAFCSFGVFAEAQENVAAPTTANPPPTNQINTTDDIQGIEAETPNNGAIQQQGVVSDEKIDSLEPTKEIKPTLRKRKVTWTTNNPSDFQLNKRVKEELKKLSSFNPRNIQVYTQGGQVRLEGVVPSPSDANKILQRARAINGVQGVTNNLQVEPVVR